MHTLAVIAVAIPAILLILFVLAAMTDGFTDWRAVLIILGIIALAVGFFWGVSYLQWEEQQPPKPKPTAEAPQ